MQICKPGCLVVIHSGILSCWKKYAKHTMDDAWVRSFFRDIRKYTCCIVTRHGWLLTEELFTPHYTLEIFPRNVKKNSSTKFPFVWAIRLEWLPRPWVFTILAKINGNNCLQTKEVARTHMTSSNLCPRPMLVKKVKCKLGIIANDRHHWLTERIFNKFDVRISFAPHLTSVTGSLSVYCSVNVLKIWKNYQDVLHEHPISDKKRQGLR